MYTGIGLETIPTQVTEDSKLKHHQVISWKISFPFLRYRFTWFKWCHLKGKATQDLFPSWVPGATQASSPVRVLSHNRRWEQIDLISTHVRNSHHKTQYAFSTLNSSSEVASVKQLAGPSRKDSPALTVHHLETCPATAWYDLQRVWTSKDCQSGTSQQYSIQRKNFNKAVNTSSTMSELSHTH